MTEAKPQIQGFLQKFLRGGAWSLFVRTFSEISTLLISMIIARMLAPEHVGVYFLAISLVSITVIFSLCGLNISIVRIIASANALGEEGQVTSSIVKARIAGLLSTLIAAAFLYFIGIELISTHVLKSPAIYDLRLLIAIWIVLWSIESLNAEIFRGFKQFHLAVLFRRFAPNLIILLVSTAVFFSSLEIDLYQYLHIVLFGWLCAVGISSFLLRQKFIKGKKRDRVTYRHLLSTSMPLWLTGFVTYSLPRLDLWILGVYESAEMLALYGAATRLTMIIGMPLFVIQAVVPPLIAESYAAKDMDELSVGLQGAAALAFYPGLALCLVYLFFGDYILAFVFGEYYASAFLALKILTVGIAIRIFTASSQSVLNMTGHGKTAMAISIFSGLLMAVGCMYAGERYGMTGIAGAAATTIAIHNILNFLFARYHVGIWIVPIIRISSIKQLLGRK